ncbi:hypothetical protein GTHT12_01256 [Geobacillus thermodenitrificans]|nr:hypothetical protein GTHT12_01256 [Geobacillus thermodenitrificans]KQB93321.1 putative membrane protein [Geobacillus sp. PA-3]
MTVFLCVGVRFVVLFLILPPSFAVITGYRTVKQGHGVLRRRVLIPASFVWPFCHRPHLL